MPAGNRSPSSFRWNAVTSVCAFPDDVSSLTDILNGDSRKSVYMPNVWVALVSGFQFGGGVFTLKFCWHMVVLLRTFYWTECAFIHIIYYHCFLPAWYLVSYLAQFIFILDFICLSHFFCCLDAYIFRTFLTSAVFSPYSYIFYESRDLGDQKLWYIWILQKHSIQFRTHG